MGLLYTAYGKIGTSRVKMLNFSAFPSFLTNSTIREKLRPKNVFICLVLDQRTEQYQLQKILPNGIDFIFFLCILHP
jgi:hypothetical protein